MSNRTAIIKLAKDGHPPVAIAKALGCHRNRVYEAIRAARLDGEDIPHFSKSGTKAPENIEDATVPRQITVPVRLFTLLTTEAERREMTITETAQHLLENALLARSARHMNKETTND